MNIKIKVVSLEKAKEIDKIFCDMWSSFPPLYWLSNVFGKEFFNVTIVRESKNIPWFCYFADGWYIPNIYIETVEEI